MCLLGSTKIIHAAKKDIESIVNESTLNGNWIKETGSIFQINSLCGIAKKIDIKDKVKNTKVNFWVLIFICFVKIKMKVQIITKADGNPISPRPEKCCVKSETTVLLKTVYWRSKTADKCIL